MLGEIRCADVVIGPDPKTVHKICKAMFGNLCQLLGSAEALQEVLESQDPADNALIIRALKTCLTVPAPKKNVFVRFFSSVGCFGHNSL
ncbi:Magnetosome protein MamM [Dissostichus eleginoides]|uniref:Magnetosome protein MamM n=1 Tax=Dissostichus eleginoides TaxID=100907 RepID=A0AAD9BHT2_DISEL|nr:Magnetosome protein MamM [Dissostichus eleginoides]KAK1882557.1 Magnetosome protein MamM [Dissostichus eleginoides]